MQFKYLQSKSGIVRVLFVVTGLISTVITSVATSKSEYLQEGLAKVPYEPDSDCPPAWLATVALVILTVSLIFSIVMLVISVSPAGRKMNAFKTVDFWGHLICALGLVTAMAFITVFVGMSISYSPSFCKSSGNKEITTNTPANEVFTMMNNAVFGPLCQLYDQIKEKLFQPTLFGIGGVCTLFNFSFATYVATLAKRDDDNDE